MMNRAHPLPLPREGDFLFIARLPGVTLRSPPAVFWPPLFPALCERGRICRACAVAQGRVGFKDYNDNNDIKDAPKKGQWDGLLNTLRRSRPMSPNGGKAPRGWGPAIAFAGAWGRCEPPQGSKAASRGTKCHCVRDARPLQDLRSSRKIAKHPSGSVAA